MESNMDLENHDHDREVVTVPRCCDNVTCTPIADGTSSQKIALASVTAIGRPQEQFGGSIWLYGSASGNRVSAGILSDGNGGVFIDDITVITTCGF